MARTATARTATSRTTPRRTGTRPARRRPAGPDRGVPATPAGHCGRLTDGAQFGHGLGSARPADHVRPVGSGRAARATVAAGAFGGGHLAGGTADRGHPGR